MKGIIIVLSMAIAGVAFANEIEREVLKLAPVEKPLGFPNLNKPNEPENMTVHKSIDSEVIQKIIERRQGVEGRHNDEIGSDMYRSTNMTPQDYMITQHFSDYCHSQFESGNCKSDPLLAFGDVKASSILSGSSYSPERQKAADDFLGNLFRLPAGEPVNNFSKERPLNVSKIMSDKKLKKQYVEALSDEVLLSFARQSFSEMMEKRKAPEGEEALSQMQMMEKEALSRFFSAGWTKSLEAMKPEELQREQLKMQAYQAWMDYERYRQTERVEALLSLLTLQNFQSMKQAQAQLSKAASN